MRTLLKLCLDDTHQGNKSIIEGTLKRVVEEFHNEMKPESTYFYADESGSRTINFVFDMKDSSQIAQIAETFFFSLNAKVHFYPVMNLEDLNAGLNSWEKKEKFYLKSDESSSSQLN